MLYDITPPITEALAVWPGDTSPSREVLLDMARGDNLTLSTLRATVHLGAHADAPSHYHHPAPSIEQRSLEVRNSKEDRDLLNRLINTVNVLRGQMHEMVRENPENASILEVHEWSLDNLESRMRKTRRSIYKSYYSRYNFNRVLDE